MTPEQRALAGRIGAAIARSRHDSRELTAAARRTFLLRFENEIVAEHPELSVAEVQRRASERRRAHMLALALKSSQARAKKRAGPAPARVTADVEASAASRGIR
jgi:hypothetical protein